MKTKNSQARSFIFLSLLCFTFVCSCAKKHFNPFFYELPIATNDYGYTTENPIKIGYSKNLEEAFSYCRYYIENLRTETGQLFRIISIGTFDNPLHESTVPTFLGMPRRGAIPRGGLLDGYNLVTGDEKDTVTLFFDVYRSDTLRVPRGLEFAGKLDSTLSK